MADQVIRMSPVRIEHDTTSSAVVLKINGHHGQKSVRVELTLEPWALKAMISQMRTGNKSILNRWLETDKELNNG